MSVQCGSMLKHCSSSHHCGTLLAQMEIGAVLLYVLRSKGRGEKYQPRFAFGESIKQRSKIMHANVTPIFTLWLAFLSYKLVTQQWHMLTNQQTNLLIKLKRRHSSINLKLFFWQRDECMSNNHFVFSSVLVSTHSC